MAALVDEAVASMNGLDAAAASFGNPVKADAGLEPAFSRLAASFRDIRDRFKLQM